MVSRIQCNKLQYRDTHLVETNQDELEDLVGGLYSCSANLEIDISNQNLILIEGLENVTDFKIEPDSEEEITSIRLAKPASETECLFPSNTYEEESKEKDEGGEEEITTEIWRPPTPPKISPVQKENNNIDTKTNLCKTVLNVTDKKFEKSPSKTPSPPQLSSMDISIWRNKTNIENEECNKASSKSVNPQEAHSESNSCLNETFDMPNDAVNHVPHSTNERDLTAHETSNPQTDTSFTKFDYCPSKRNNEHLPLVLGDIVSPKSLNINLNSADTTIVLEEPTLVHLIDKLPLVEATSTRFPAPTQKHLSLIPDSKEDVNNSTTSRDNASVIEENSLIERTKSPSLSSSLSNEGIGLNSTKSKCQIQGNSATVSDRRGTFTVSNSDTLNVFPNIAIVSPNTRRDTYTGITSEDTQYNIVNETKEQHVTSNSINTSNLTHSSSMDTLSNSSLSLPQVPTIPLQTPNKSTPVVAPSSEGRSKRTLKRTGPSRPGGSSSASTSNLLKGLSAYRPSAKAKTPENRALPAKSLAPLQVISNTPSYMATTASYSRKLNLHGSTGSILGNKGNPNTTAPAKSKPGVSPEQSTTHRSVTSNENEEPRAQLMSSKKDIVG